MPSVIGQVVLAITYALLALSSIGCLQTYAAKNGMESRSFAYGIFVINGLYGLGGLLSTFSCNIDQPDTTFLLTEVSVVLPLFATEVWSRGCVFPKQTELKYIPILMGFATICAYLATNTIRSDLVKLNLTYCFFCLLYVGSTTGNGFAVIASILFYVSYCMQCKQYFILSNIFLMWFTTSALYTLYPEYLEEVQREYEEAQKKSNKM